MNAPEDWNVIWKWQWFRRNAWQPHFRDPRHPEGRPARSAAIYGQILQQFDAVKVLDCSCGLGLRAICLQESGFDVTGTDISPSAIQHALQLAEESGISLRFRQCVWHDLGECFGPDFDAIINDEFAMTGSRSELRFAAHNFYSVLKPGGILAFTGANQWSEQEERAAKIERLFNSQPRFQLRGDDDSGGSHLTLLVARDKTEQGVVDNYLFVSRDENGPQLETAAICNSVDWSWSDFQAVCNEAGFSSLESIKVPLGARDHVLNVARK
jgi:2-polyprenyl-3-methyl-5-hydroxy-6-metoxy-1,4-benzoquinol methylase